ncbi:MAG: hypothetical protein QMC80_07960 [Thermoplasmatales archaeon]|nr:hypothetical protein [Thermoplasmatales archaeon]
MGFDENDVMGVWQSKDEGIKAGLGIERLVRTCTCIPSWKI